MRPQHAQSRAAFIRRHLVWALPGILLSGLVLSAAPPTWWSQRGATSNNQPDDFAAANIGQLKHFATKAADELNARLPGGAGTSINTLVQSWSQPPAPGVTRDDFAALTVGQLKAIAKPFYSRLLAVQYSTSYPAWLQAASSTDSELANLGQLKSVFSFDLTAPSGQLPAWWQRFYFNGQTGIDPTNDADGDGLSNFQEYEQQSDPQNYYNGQTLTLQIVGGNFQTQASGQWFGQPLVLEVRGTELLTNAPVTFEVVGTSASLSASSGGEETQYKEVRTNAQGLASVWVKATDLEPIEVRATAAGFQTSFFLNRYHPPQAGRRLWLKAGDAAVDASDMVQSWTSGILSASAPAVSARPALFRGGLAGHPVVRFDGADDVLTGSMGYAASSGDLTIYCVHRRTQASSWSAPFSLSVQPGQNGAPLITWRENGGLLGINNVGASADGLYVDVANTKRFLITGLTRAGSALSLRTTDGPTFWTANGTQSWSSQSSSLFALGRHYHAGPSHLRGDIAEVLVYDRALNAHELQEVENYLREKYSLAMGDRDTDGIPDWWEAQFGLNPDSGADASTDPDGDGFTNLEEFSASSDPLDYASRPTGTIPLTLAVITGQYQAGPAGEMLPVPLSVKVAGAGGTPLANVPVRFVVKRGQVLLGTGGNLTETVFTNSDGIAATNIRAPATVGSTGEVSASVGQSATFEAFATGTDSLVGHWKFDEAGGSSLSDQSLLGTTVGILGATGPGFGPGLNGSSALLFDGQGDTTGWLKQQNFLSFGQGSFTISLWFKSGMNNYGRLIGNGSWYSVKGYSLELSSRPGLGFGYLQFNLSSKTSSTAADALHLVTKDKFNDNQWHHVACVVNREDGKVVVYVDGISREFDPAASTGQGLSFTAGLPEANISAMPNLDATSGESLRFGQYQTVGNPFHGSLDEVRIYSSPLNAAQLAQIRLPADWQQQYFGGTGIDPDADSDNDGLSNIAEYQGGTNPTLVDTDYDGRSDSQEIADGTDPLSDQSVLPVRLSHWRLSDGSLLGERGQQPIVSSTNVLAPAWRGNGLNTAANTTSRLVYRELEPDGTANVNLQRGTVRFWIKPNWSSTTAGGTGPGGWSRMMEVGSWTANSTFGFWSVHFNPAGTQIIFSGQDSSGHGWSTFWHGISWSANQWHQVAIAYSPTQSKLFIDGVHVSTGSGVTHFPPASTRVHGFSIGTSRSGIERTNAIMDEVETFNYELPASEIQSDYTSAVQFGADGDDDGMPDAWEIQYGLDPNDPADANEDADGDGLSNLAEYQAGTSPTIPTVNDLNTVVAWWKFDEDSGSTILDVAPGARNGAILGTPTRPTGVFGNSLDFDAFASPKQTVSIPHPTLFAGLQKFTISAWIRPKNLIYTQHQEILRKEDGSQRVLLSFQEYGTILSFGINTGGTYQELDVPVQPATLTTGAWHHVAATFDGQKAKIYLNGNLIGEQPRTGSLTVGTSATTYIGSLINANEFFHGQIDEVKIHSRALVSEELRALYSHDTDGDGMPDEWEAKYGLDPNDPSDAGQDLDGDGVSNSEEAEAGSHPTNPDTDGDGVFDGEDGAATDPELSPSRLPEVSYAVIELQNMPASWNSLFINNKAQVLSDAPLRLWSEGQIILDITELPEHFHRMGPAVFDDHGNIYAQVRKEVWYYDENTESWEVEPYEDGHLKWTASGTVTFLPPYVPPGSHASIQTPFPYPFAVSGNGVLATGAQIGKTFDGNPNDVGTPYSAGVRFANGVYTVIHSPAPHGAGTSQSPYAGHLVFPAAINNSLAVVGRVFTYNGSASTISFQGEKICFPDNTAEILPQDSTWRTTSLNDQNPPNIVGHTSHFPAENRNAVMWVKVNGHWKHKNLGSYNTATGQNSIVPGTPSKINDRFEIVGTFGLWRNGLVQSPSEVLDSDLWRLISIHDINNTGAMVGFAQNKSSGTNSAVILLPFELAIDSDNNNGFDLPRRTQAERDARGEEGDDEKPGKVILVNDWDTDGDSIPDYADGYNLLGDQVDPDNLSEGARFVPIIFHMSAFDWENAKIKFSYPASDPASVVEQEGEEYWVLPETGKLRLWTKDAGEERNAQTVGEGEAGAGDFVEPDLEYTPEELGLSAEQPEVILYVEAVGLSEQSADVEIKVEVDPTGTMGFSLSDATRVTLTRKELYAKPYDGTEFEPTDRLVQSNLSSEDFHEEITFEGSAWVENVNSQGGQVNQLTLSDYDLSSSGAGIQGAQDSYLSVHVVDYSLHDIQSRVSWQAQPQHGDAKIGLMFRDSGEPDSRAILVGLDSAGNVIVEHRATSSGNLVRVASAPALVSPARLRLVQQVGMVRAYQSSDGQSWSQIGAAVDFGIPGSTLAGLFAASGSAQHTASGSFRGVNFPLDSETIDIEPFSGGPFSVFKYRVYDPRESGVNEVKFGNQSIPLTRNGSFYETEEFVCAGEGKDVDIAGIPDKVLRLGDAELLPFEYNPDGWEWLDVREGAKLTKEQKAVAKAASETASHMYDQGWTGTDNASFGREWHERCGQRFANKKGFASDLYVKQEAGGLRIVGLGSKQGVNVDGTLQLDLVEFNDMNYRPAKGDLLDVGKVEAAYDFKSGHGSGFDGQFRQRFRDWLPGKKLYAVQSNYYWKPQDGWVKSKLRGLRGPIRAVGLAATGLIFLSAWDASAKAEEIVGEVERFQAGDHTGIPGNNPLMHRIHIFELTNEYLDLLGDPGAGKLMNTRSFLKDLENPELWSEVPYNGTL